MAITLNPDSSIIGRTRTQPDTDSLFRRPSLKKKKLDNSDSGSASRSGIGSSSSNSPPLDIMSSLLSPQGATTTISSPVDAVQHSGNRRLKGKGSGLTLAGSFPPPTPLSHPAAADPTKSSAASMNPTSEAPDYFAQHIVMSPPATNTFGGSALEAAFAPAQPQQHQPLSPPQPHRESSSQHTSDPFSTSFGSFGTSSGRSSLSIPSGALSGAAFPAGSASRISLPPTTGKFSFGSANPGGSSAGSGLYGGVAMSARSSRQSTTSSIGSIAGCSINSGASSGANSTSTSGMADELIRFRPIEPDSLASLLAESEKAAESESKPDANAGQQSHDNVLIIDIRSSASYSSARIKSSINVCAPSTLLKRPGITLDHVEEEMLGSERDRRRFKRWREGPRRIRQKNHDSSATASPSLSRSNSKSKKTASPQHRPGSPKGKPSPGTPQRPLHPHNSSFGSQKGSSAASSPHAEVNATDMAEASASKIVPASANGVTQIVVLDTDTARVADGGKPTTGGGASCLVGMLRKFEAAGFAGELRWLVGGFNKFAGCPGAMKADLIDRAPLSDRDAQDDEEIESGKGGSAENGGRTISAAASNQAQDRHKLKLERNDSSYRRSSAPVQADADAANANASKPADAQAKSFKRRLFVQPRSLPLSAFSISTTTSNPGASNLGDKGGISGPRTRDATSACANPFFDNIRQNRELAHGVTERVPMPLPDLSSEQAAALPPFLQRLTDKTESARAEELAQGFFAIEKAEQRRLMSTMQQHSAESGKDPRDAIPSLNMGGDGVTNSPSPGGPTRKPTQLSSSLAGINGANPTVRAASSDETLSGLQRQPLSPFPFSIAAALERGADNRYDNIWTYEHSRVRLNHPKRLADPNSNYINASFVQPAREFGCARTYIATQAPLPSTFESFWMMCWEQNVRVIVMVTREHEAGRIQAHRYWESTCYGRDIRLRQIREQCYDSSGNEVHDTEEANRLASNANDEGGGGLFPSIPLTSSEGGKRKPVLIRRTMALSNASEPSEGEHIITQLQYVAWPDYTVPESPQSLLRLLDVADDAQFEAEQQLEKATPTDSQSYFSHSFNGAAAVSMSQESKPVGPMLVHCSAGVGRTGTFIAVDCALDAIRRQRGRSKGTEPAGVWQNGIAAAHEAQTAAAAAHKAQQSSSPSARHGRSDNLAFSTPPRQPALQQLPPEDVPMQGIRQTEDAPPFFDPTSMRNAARRGSIQPSESDFENDSSATSPAPSSPEPSTGYHAPSPLPTPLRHLDSMRLSGIGPASGAEGSSVPIFLPNTTWESSEQHETPMSIDAASSQPALTGAHAGLTLAQTQPLGDVDIIRRVVEVMREQRMSSVQTTRQYVFVYTAVLEGVLRELKAEERQ
ncbi:hypothetical protein OC846_006499 [Tilletia horrida]|uniref:protein-tyrosine-phosphatase n=1 Tax=Tilletia horrida TaxID=155126 RepID=A0AAN6GJW0_9BASI|nr:hypothetical protein OC845_006477 [Tilletia horrida]KAK0543213.1 hypothetical protein OC846_006499 [Tilletia horrida]KAK0559699.1 hypothetical protein OC861_006558 [Tilletia horrida]